MFRFVRPSPVSWTYKMQKSDEVSLDQKYVFDICAAISNGQNSHGLENRKQGQLCNRDGSQLPAGFYSYTLLVRILMKL